jgi:phosphoribosylformimino-5-aminoimidazole carboxamide ribotide isomerase
MLVIPAIDIRSQRVVRLLQGDFTKETFYSGNPVEVAKRWQADGAKLLHIVDLDGAFTGEPRNLDIAVDIKNQINIPIEFGGGLRTDDSVEKVISKGIERTIIGTRAYTDDEFLKRTIARYGNRIVVSIDAAGENIAAEGWTSLTSIKAQDLSRRIEALGVKTIIYTNILRDGTLERPQLKQAEEILDSVKIDVIIAGGISSIQDILDLKNLKRPNLYGVIVGKALYEKRIDLKEAIRLAEG